MIIVTGANGQLGRMVVEQLLTRVPAEQIGVSVRDPQKAQDLQQRGVRVRRGDYSDPASLAHAFEGAAQVLIVSVNSFGEALVRMQRTAIEAAKQAGARRILYTSQMGSSPASPCAPLLDHHATEKILHESGVPFTSLRNGFYASSALLLLGNALQTGEIIVPEDGPVAWTTHADLAEATAVVLSEGGLDGISPVLTASETLDFAAIAAMASDLAGRPIRRIVVQDAQYRASLVAHGLPEEMAGLLLSIFLASRRGEFNRVDLTLARLIGHEPTPFRDVLKGVISQAS